MEAVSEPDQLAGDAGVGGVGQIQEEKTGHIDEKAEGYTKSVFHPADDGDFFTG